MLIAIFLGMSCAALDTRVALITCNTVAYEYNKYPSMKICFFCNLTSNMGFIISQGINPLVRCFNRDFVLQYLLNNFLICSLNSLTYIHCLIVNLRIFLIFIIIIILILIILSNQKLLF